MNTPQTSQGATDQELLREVDRVRAAYADFEKENIPSTLWAPFSINEAAYRAHQSHVFATMMRGIGLQSLAGLRLLDYGCGDGRHLRHYLNCDADPELLSGIDINPTALARARKCTPHLDIRNGDGVRIPYEDNTFDLVTMCMVLSSIGLEALQRELVRELLRVLKPGGYLFSWELLHTAGPSGHRGQPFSVTSLIPGKIIDRRTASHQPRPSEIARPMRGFTRLIAPIIDRLAFTPNYEILLLQPKSVS